MLRTPTVVLWSMLAAAGLGCQETAAPALSGTAHSTQERAAAKSAYRDSFGIDTTRLVPTGRGTFWILEPGGAWTLRDGATTLTVTVLDQTRLVDGVTARIVEEREERGGVPHEVARNYLALDPATGDVYCFGEEVDEYRGGKVISHDGSWLAGVNGARFGLLIPGRPMPGDRFQNEFAPGIAMDRGEVVAVNERVETPAGVFENCLHIVETTPLDSDVSHKWYAPGKGLVKDGGFVLASVSGVPGN